MGVRRVCAPVRQALRIAAQPSATSAVPGTAFSSCTNAVQELDCVQDLERSNSTYSASTSDQFQEDARGPVGEHGTSYLGSRAPFNPSSIAKSLCRLTLASNQILSPKPFYPSLPLSQTSASLLGSSFSTSAILAASATAKTDSQSVQTSGQSLGTPEVLRAPSTLGTVMESPKLVLEGQAKSSESPSQVRRPYKRATRGDQAPANPMPGARQLATEAQGSATEQGAQTAQRALPPLPPRKKVKALRKTAQHIMNILDQEAVAALKQKKNYPEFRAGDVLELDLIVPENRRRTAIIRGVCLSRRNAGVGSSFVIRRVVAGEGMEYTYPLYSPNIQSIKIIERRPVRRAKLYYLRNWNPQECTV